jgi:hypothetical protein
MGGSRVRTSRPLSDWVAWAPRDHGAVVSLESLSLPNDGAERLDARAMPQFSDGWGREAIEVSSEDGAAGTLALGLRAVRSGELVVELDERSHPIPVTRPAVEVIARLEEAWPPAEISDAEISVLAREHPALRYALIDRLAAESAPAPGVYHLLAWELLDAFIAATLDALNGQFSEPPVPVRHLIAPAGARLAAPVEQLYEGLRSDEPGLARAGSDALTTHITAADPARIPDRSRALLAEMLAAIERFDPLLTFLVRRARRHLAGGSTQPLGSTIPLEIASAATVGEREFGEELVEGLFRVALTLTSDRKLGVAVEIPMTLPGTSAEALIELYQGAILLPVEISGASSSSTYWVALSPTATGLGGTLLNLALPQEDVRVSLNHPAIGALQARRLEPAESTRSRSVSDSAGQRVWEQVASVADGGSDSSATESES